MSKKLGLVEIRESLFNKDTSMFPLILPGDIPVVEKSSKYRTDDIIVFPKDEKLIAHRVIYIPFENNYLIAKGDNNPKSDGKILLDQILGRVTTVKRGKETFRLSHFYLTQSSTYLKEIARVTKMFNKRSLDHIILKGLPLHLYFDRKPPKRLYYDIDILIKRKDFKKTEIILTKLGFQKIQSTLFGKYIEKSSQISYFKSVNDFFVVIDLHKEPAIGLTKITTANRLLSISKFTKYLFDNKRQIEINNNNYQILSNEALMIYLLIHLFHHNFKGTYRMDFIDNFVQKNKINWQEVKKKTVSLKLQNIVYLGTIFMKKYYQTPFDKEFLNAIKPGIITRIISTIIVIFASPFDISGRDKEGALRFCYLVVLSQANVVEKIGVIFSKKTIDYFFLTTKSLLSRIFKKSS